MSTLASRERTIRVVAHEASIESDAAARSLERWMRQNPGSTYDDRLAAVKSLAQHYNARLAPALSASAMASIAPEVPAGATGVILESSMDADGFQRKASVIAAHSFPSDAGPMMGTLISDLAAGAITRTIQKYIQLGDTGVHRWWTDEGPKDFPASAPRGGKNRKWKRVTEPGACEWCKEQSNPFRRHSGCKCSVVRR